jgi:hypothetical protein
VDRLYLQMAIWTALASLLSLCGLMHGSQLGWYTAKDDIGWQFAAGYGFVALSALVLWVLQIRGVMEKPFGDEEEEEDVKVAYRSSLYDPRHQKKRGESRVRSSSMTILESGSPGRDRLSGRIDNLEVDPMWPTDDRSHRLTF